MASGRLPGIFAEQDRNLSRDLNKLLKLLAKGNAEAAVFLLPAREIRRLKAKYSEKKPRRAIKRQGEKQRKDPDVLAFPEPRGFPHPETKKRFLGEIYINKDLARGTYTAYKSRKTYVVYLLIHGLLHLLGYTHDGRRDTIKMQKLEQRLLSGVVRRSRAYRQMPPS